MRNGILAVVGGTPLIQLSRVLRHRQVTLFVKLEQFNPGGSMKDRPALEIIEHGLGTGQIGPQTVVIESSSGNMGIGLAQACLYHKLRFICVVDLKTTAQNVCLLKAYRSEVETVTEPDAATGEYLPARIRRVKEMLTLYPDSFWPNQYANERNSRAHHRTMHEIATQLNGDIDYLFCATSTCGTLRGCSEYIKERGLTTKVIAVDAKGSVIFDRQKGKRLIPGHGAALVPALYREDLADCYVHVTDEDCVVGCHRLLQEEAILAGGSSGAIISAIDGFCHKMSNGSVCVAILPDRGERYLDTIYCDEWLREHFGELLWKKTTAAPIPAIATS